MVRKVVLWILLLTVNSIVCIQTESGSLDANVYSDGAPAHLAPMGFDFLPTSKLTEILDVLNSVRRISPELLRHLNVYYRETFDKETMMLKNIGVKSAEGLPVIDDAINFLNGRGFRPPVPTLRLDAGLTAAAYDLCEAIVKEGKITHDAGSGRENVQKRILQYGSLPTGSVSLGESVWAGFKWHPLRAMLDMIIDDGVPSRNRRLNIYSDSEFVGIGFIPASKNPSGFAVLTLVFASKGYEMNPTLLTKETMKKIGMS